MTEDEFDDKDFLIADSAGEGDSPDGDEIEGEDDFEPEADF